MKGGRVVENGTYQDLKARNVNFSAWVTDVIHMEDDPSGLIDNVSEIRLDPQSNANQPLAASPLRPPLAGTFSHLQARRKSKPRSSPLASAKPINADSNTIRQIMELNSNSMQNAQLNEITISKMIERSQTSILTGNSTRPPANFANQDVVTRTIEANQLTVHSLHNFDVGTLEPGQESHTSPYVQFFKDGPGAVVGYFFLFLFVSSHGFRVFSGRSDSLTKDVWLMYVVDEPDPDSYRTNIIVLACLSLVIALSILLRGYAFLRIMVSKGSSWHSKILESVLRAPMSFYDVTPLGHILSFFARHLFSVDEILPDTALQVLTFLPLVVGTMVIACIYVPWLWATVPVIIALWVLVSFACIAVQNVFKNLESSNKSPMFAHLSTTLEGLFLIRLYHSEERFDFFNNTLIDADHKALYCLLLGMRTVLTPVRAFMSSCLDVISSVFIYITGLFIVLFPITASQAGVAVSNSLQLLLFVPWLVKMFFELDSSMSSVSSLVYFGVHAPRETSPRGTVVPPQNWPENGEIEFKDVTSKYQRYGVSVLKNVSFHIKPKEKIAIVGRSGSGKTTVLMSLLRIIEPTEGSILIDGIDVTSISLTNLRSRIAIIPQEPVMLTGTIRTNLDPFGNASDDAMWAALNAVHLGEKISEMPDKLDTTITEPAVTVDRDTERLIQQVMNDNFAHCTVIFLATRFRVIVQMDKVMVMKHGEIVEFDTPLVLLDNPKSKFSLMLSQTGDVDPAYLRQLAQRKASQKEMNGTSTSLNSGSSLSSISLLRQSSRSSTHMPKALGALFQNGAVLTSILQPSSSEAPGQTAQISVISNGPGDDEAGSQDNLLGPSSIVVLKKD
ncbi:Multidrug resistance-associated protein 4 [Kappamyces sp. JEL0680]|nr:Multidrug resistance-associated protein 4 [Kappamyces sp. JEL0680]